MKRDGQVTRGGMHANPDSMQPRGGEETRTRNNLCLQSFSTARGYDGTEVSVSPLWGPNDPLICKGICVGDVGQVAKEIYTHHGGVPGSPSRPGHDGPRTHYQWAGIAGLSGKWLHYPGPRTRSVARSLVRVHNFMPNIQTPTESPCTTRPTDHGAPHSLPLPLGQAHLVL